MATPQAPNNQRARTGYQEIDQIRDADGVVAIISKRVSGPPLFTIGLFKEFERDGQMEKSSFWSVRQYEAILRVLAIVVPKVRVLEKEAAAEYDRNQRPGNR